MNVLSTPQNRIQAGQIPYTNATECAAMLGVELARMLTLLESLDSEDWVKPTACTAWNVRDMIAHQAGGYASGTSYWEMIRQYSRLPKKGQLPEDAINESQLNERAGRSPTELIAELRKVGAVTIQNWAYHFNLIKWITVSHPVGGQLSVRHLMWVTHCRDTWMHRLDICRATGRSFEQTPEQDGRIAALVMRDVAIALDGKQKQGRLQFNLTGVAGGFYELGQGSTSATIEMDVLDFNIYASGRMTYEQALAKASISGDVSLGQSSLKNILILY